MADKALCLFLMVPWVGLQCVIVAFPGPTHFCNSISQVISDDSGEPEPSLLLHRKMRCTLRIRPLLMSLAQLGSSIFSFIMNDKNTISAIIACTV